MSVLPLSEIEVLGLLSILEQCSDFPLSLTNIRRRLLELSQHSNSVPYLPTHAISEPLDTYAETRDETLDIQGELYQLFPFSKLKRE